MALHVYEKHKETGGDKNPLKRETYHVNLYLIDFSIEGTFQSMKHIGTTA